jgi:hypothetical protein
LGEGWDLVFRPIYRPLYISILTQERSVKMTEK